MASQALGPVAGRCRRAVCSVGDVCTAGDNCVICRQDEGDLGDLVVVVTCRQVCEGVTGGAMEAVPLVLACRKVCAGVTGGTVEVAGAATACRRVCPAVIVGTTDAVGACRKVLCDSVSDPVVAADREAQNS